jgi:hypothetical protein
LILLASLPSADSPGRTIVATLRARYAVTLTASYVGVLAAVLLIPFAASLQAFGRRPDGEAEWRWTVTLLSAAGALSLLLAGSALLAAAALVANRVADESSVSALFTGAKTCFTFALTPFGVVVLANARTLSSSRIPVRWLIRLDLEIGVLALISSAAVFVNGDWFGAAEQVVAVMGLLVALWVAAIALVMLEGASAARLG